MKIVLITMVLCSESFKCNSLVWFGGILFQHSGQVCQIFLDLKFQNGGKYTKLPLNYQMVTDYTKCPKYILNCHRAYQPFQFQGPRKFTQIGIFGLKIYHLATLIPDRKKAEIKSKCISLTQRFLCRKKSGFRRKFQGSFQSSILWSWGQCWICRRFCQISNK
jgi:hypothetical protein